MKLRHLVQDRPNNCGQTCVAIVTNRSIRHAERLMGKTGLTYMIDLRRALMAQGFAVTRVQRGRIPDTDQSLIVSVRGPKGGGHIVVKNGFIVHDPAYQAPMMISQFKQKLKARGWRTTSYFEFW